MNFNYGNGFAYGREITDEMLQLILTSKLSERELRLVRNCMRYAKDDPAGMPGHNLAVIVSKMMEIMQIDEAIVQDAIDSLSQEAELCNEEKPQPQFCTSFEVRNDYVEEPSWSGCNCEVCREARQEFPGMVKGTVFVKTKVDTSDLDTLTDRLIAIGEALSKVK